MSDVIPDARKMVFFALLGLFIFVGEVVGLAFINASPPVNFFHYPIGLGVNVLVAQLVLLMDTVLGEKGLNVSPFIALVLSWIVLLVKLLVATDSLGVYFYLLVTLPYLAVIVLDITDVRSLPSRQFWSITVVFFILLSPDALKRLSTQLAGLENLSVPFYLLPVFLFFIALSYGEDVTVPIEKWLTKNYRRMIYSTCFIVVLGIPLWTTFPAPQGKQSYFKGKIKSPVLHEGVSQKDLPNIIVISIDTLRSDVIGGTFKPKPRVPNLRQFQDHSLRLTRTYGPSSWTLPNHGSLLSGDLPMEHGAGKTLFSRLTPTTSLFPQYLQKLGYKTAAFTGKDLREEDGFSRGFDHYHRPPDPYLGAMPGGLKLAAWLLSENSLSLPPLNKRQYAYFKARSNRAESWLDQRSSDQPFLIFLQTNELKNYTKHYPTRFTQLKNQHSQLAEALLDEDTPSLDLSPLSPAEKKRWRRFEKSFSKQERQRFKKRRKEFPPHLLKYHRPFIRLLPPDALRMFKDQIVRLSPDNWQKIHNVTTNELEFVTPWKRNSLKRLKRLTPTVLRARRALYTSHLQSVDEQFGHFIDYLKSNEYYENSLIVVLSPYGEGFSLDPFVIGHGLRTNLDYEGQLHDVLLNVPVWIKPPHYKKGGVRFSGSLGLREVFPLILDHVGVQLPDRYSPADGLDLKDIMAGDLREKPKVLEGSIESGREYRPKFFTRLQNYKLIIDSNRQIKEFWKVESDGQQEGYVPSSEVPRPIKISLRNRMRTRLNVYFRMRNNNELPLAYKISDVNSLEFLLRQRENLKNP